MRFIFIIFVLFGVFFFGFLVLVNSDEVLICSCFDNFFVNLSFEGLILGWLSFGGNFYYGFGY